MFTPSKVTFLVSALLAGAAFTTTASALVVTEQAIAREASEGPRGEGGKKGGHPAIEVTEQLLAREASEGPRGEGGKKGGHPAIEVSDQLARRGVDDTGPDDHGGRGRGGRG